MTDDNIIVRQADHANIQSDSDDAPNEPHYPSGDFDDIDKIRDGDDDDDDFENADYEPRWQVQTLQARPCRW